MKIKLIENILDAEIRKRKESYLITKNMQDSETVYNLLECKDLLFLVERKQKSMKEIEKICIEYNETDLDPLNAMERILPHFNLR